MELLALTDEIRCVIQTLDTTIKYHISDYQLKDQPHVLSKYLLYANSSDVVSIVGTCPSGLETKLSSRISTLKRKKTLMKKGFKETFRMANWYK